MFIEVAVPAPLTHALTYSVPPLLGVKPVPGSRVLVELGRRKVLGLALQLTERAPAGVERIKDIVDVLDAEPIVPPELLRFLVELSGYYLAPMGEVMKLALPVLSKGEAARVTEQEPRLQLKSVGKRVQYVEVIPEAETPELKGQASEILSHLRERGAMPVARLEEQWKNARPAVSRLRQLGLVRVEDRELPRDPFFREPIPRDQAPPPTEPQRAAMDTIAAALRTPGPSGFLLHGVTGSGKTEVYLNAIAEALALERGALVLVPEIALTPQLVARFRARFGDGLAVLHSGLSQGDRRMMWDLLWQRQVRVAIGARSALFAPVPDLGLLIVDEEHDSSFKQEEGVRYNARDMAILRGHRAGAVCVLGSATPSLETEHLVRERRITRLRLPGRARAASILPRVEVIDMRKAERSPCGDPRLSLPLHQAIEETLARREQVILFLNRRGFAPSVVCESCGTISMCPLCSVPLTYHRTTGLVRCHYCDHQRRFDGKCRRCRSTQLSLEGLGTERLEDTIQQVFPAARVARLDRDVASGSKAEAILDQVRAHEVDILIGTQMVAKGHDIPRVTLVGVINADGALSMPDLRATERTFQLLVQVAGRAGRGEVQGRVLLQTRDPSNPAIVSATRHDVDGFLERELMARSELAYPPFSRMVMVRIDAPDEPRCRHAATQLAAAARASTPVHIGEVEVLGPAPAPIARLRARYRFQILLKSRERRPLRYVAQVILDAEHKLPQGLRVVVDVDPISML
ncbi:MAG: primosomal protein N' [Polyangiaceae bacterium]|jgi:primosomal protein N' (replication factor Y)|nr:primosomal protein N' [Polyangiaceae bacterium]